MSLNENEQKVCFLNKKIDEITNDFDIYNNLNIQNTNNIEQNIQSNKNNISLIDTNINSYNKTESDNIFATKTELINSISLDKFYLKTKINNNIDISQQDSIIISKSLIPKNDLEINLGSTEKKFKELYLSGNTIHLGEQEIKSTIEGIEMNSLDIKNIIKIKYENNELKIMKNGIDYSIIKNKININKNIIINLQEQINEMKNKLNI